MRHVFFGFVTLGLAWAVAFLTRADEGLPLDPRLKPLPTDKLTDKLGPFVRLDDTTVLAIDTSATFVSRDEGKTWSSPWPLFPDGRKIKVSNERAMLRTPSCRRTSCAAWTGARRGMMSRSCMMIGPARSAT